MSSRLSFALVSIAALGAAPAAAQPVTEPAATTAPASQSVADRIELRDIDRACVRIVKIFGADPYVFDSRETRVRRLVADVEAGFGTGFFVDPSGLIATAAHVVAGAHVIAIVPTGSDDAVPAQIVYVDPLHDIAFIRAAITPPAVIRVPNTQRRLTIAEPVSTSGFPLDHRQRFPAAITGVLSRENNNGSLTTSLAVNPGNSGGPVVDARGELVGLVSMGSNTRAGAQGFSILEPLRFVAPDLAIARELSQARVDPPSDYDRSLARVVSDLVGTDTERRLFERTPIDVILRAASSPSSPEAALVVAAHAWNIHIDTLEHYGVREIAQLPESARATASQLREVAVRLVGETLRTSPFVRTSYSFAPSVAVQGARSFVVRSTSGSD